MSTKHFILDPFLNIFLLVEMSIDTFFYIALPLDFLGVLSKYHLIS